MIVLVASCSRVSVDDVVVGSCWLLAKCGCKVAMTFRSWSEV
jgi:hypothetical protein